MRAHAMPEPEKQTHLLTQIAFTLANAYRDPKSAKIKFNDLQPWVRIRKAGRSAAEILSAFLAYGAKTK